VIEAFSGRDMGHDASLSALGQWAYTGVTYLPSLIDVKGTVEALTGIASGCIRSW